MGCKRSSLTKLRWGKAVLLEVNGASQIPPYALATIGAVNFLELAAKVVFRCGSARLGRRRWPAT